MPRESPPGPAHRHCSVLVLVSTAESGIFAMVVHTMPAPKLVEAKKNPTTVNLNLEEQIRVRAYQPYEERGHTPGHEAEDWLVAEREILGRDEG